VFAPEADQQEKLMNKLRFKLACWIGGPILQYRLNETEQLRCLATELESFIVKGENVIDEPTDLYEEDNSENYCQSCGIRLDENGNCPDLSV
jgi:hypothetical protein